MIAARAAASGPPPDELVPHRPRHWLPSVLTAIVGGALIAALVSGAEEVYENVQAQAGLARIDEPVLSWMVAHRNPTLDAVMTVFTNVGGVLVMTILATVTTIGLALLWRSWTPVALMVVACAGSVTMTSVGKDLAGRARPPHELAVPPYEASPSFPSGHTLNSTVIAMVIAYLVVIHVESRLARTVTVIGLAVYVVAIGLSRVYLGHHWFTDVAAGWLIGAAWATVVIMAHRLLVLQGRRRAGPGSNRDADDRGAGDRHTDESPVGPASVT